MPKGIFVRSEEHKRKLREVLNKHRGTGFKGKSGFYEKSFWNKVKKTQTCWIWTGAIRSKKSPYGIVRLNDKRFLVHRVSWIIQNGNIPNGLLICHKCDNTLCVRPSHLFSGTHTDNNRDRENKNRSKWRHHKKGDKTCDCIGCDWVIKHQYEFPK